MLDAIEANAKKYPDKPAYAWLDGKGEIETTVTYREAWKRIDTITWHLENSWGAQQGDAVLLVYAPGIDFMFAHLGCLRAGCVAVPVYPPELAGKRAKKGVDKLSLIAADCGATVALTTKAYHRATCLTTWNPLSDLDWPELSWQATNNLKWNKKGEAVDVDGDDLAFLQYTSGSTGNPKGVMILHKNLMHNAAFIVKHCHPQGVKSKVITWLPQCHDMGLIGNYTVALVAGATLYCMSPLSFLSDPSLWMLCASKYKCQITIAPNFACGLIARKWKDSRAVTSGKDKFDLSCLTAAGSGAEPINPHTVAEFVNIFGKFGFNAAAVSQSVSQSGFYL